MYKHTNTPLTKKGSIMTIRQANSEDLHTVLDITHTTINEIFPHYYPTGAVHIYIDYHNIEAIERDIADGRVFLCIADGKAVGTVTLCEDEIQRLYVLPSMQGKGAGRTLICFAEAELFKTYDKIIVEASLPAKGLYKKIGYTETEYLSMQAENGDVLCWDKMEKRR